MLRAAIVMAALWVTPAWAKVDMVEASGRLHVEINGRITAADAVAFFKLIDSIDGPSKIGPELKQTMNVELASPGGSLGAAVSIGWLVREHSMSTSVEAGRECVSACVFILQAGVERAVFGRLGLHRPAFTGAKFAALSREAAQKKDHKMAENVADYWRFMGGSDEALQLMLSVPSNELMWIETPDAAQRLKLMGSDPAWAGSR
jgi:hypothetical protein